MARATELTDAQRRLAGSAARHMLEFGLRTTMPDRAVSLFVEAVCWTAETAPRESVGMLRRCLEPDAVRASGYEDLPTMAKHFSRLFDMDSSFAYDLVRAIIEHEEDP